MNRDRQKLIDDHAASISHDMDKEARLALRSSLRRLLVLEEHAIEKMEPHADRQSTAVNYVKALKARNALEDALLYLARRDMGEVKAALQSLAGLSAPRPPRAPRKKPTFQQEWYQEDDLANSPG